MSNPVWGLLAKSQTDNETIEEAIARLILEHEQDEASHLGAGESLQSHKASEIIDHVVDSVVADKIIMGAVDFSKMSADKAMMISCFESLDGWNYIVKMGTGTITLTLFGVKLKTQASSGMGVVLSTVSESPSNLVDFTKYMLFQTSVAMYRDTEQEGSIILGANDYGCGFKIIDDELYAWCDASGVDETLVKITGYDVKLFHTYRVVNDPAIPSISYYVDGVLEHTQTDEIPASSTSYTCFYSITPTENAIKYMFLRDLLISIDR